MRVREARRGRSLSRWSVITVGSLLASLAVGGCSDHVTRAAKVAPAAPAPAAAAASPEAPDTCPHQTPEAWEAFLARAAADPRWVETCENGPCDAAHHAFVAATVQSVFERCAGFLARHPAIDRCSRNLRDFTPAWLQQHSVDTYGFTVDNPTYLAAQEAAEMPEGMMRPPPALIAALPLRSRVEAAAREHGLPYLTHESALGGVRTFVLVPDPGGRFDQWMLLNFTGKTQPAIDPTTPMSFLAVQKRDAAGRELPRVKLHFRDYSLVRSGGQNRLNLVDSRNGKCHACHVSGVRQLIPRRTPALDARPVRGDPGYAPHGSRPPADFAHERLLALNARLRSYGLPDWDGRVVPEHHGPALGEAQGCTECHDGHTRGVLTVLTSTAQIQRKISEELSMPPARGLVDLLERSEMRHPPLSRAEGEALDDAFDAHEAIDQQFQDSRLPALRRWLLEASCR